MQAATGMTMIPSQRRQVVDGRGRTWAVSKVGWEEAEAEDSLPSQDHEEFIAASNAHSVRYLVAGAHAVAHHARPRATKDLDILLEVTQVPGCPSFEAAWTNRVEAHFGRAKAHYLGLDDLIRAKEAAGRAQDRADVRALRRVKSQESRRLSRPGFRP